MSKKMKVPSIFKNNEPKPAWQWPSCKNPKTLSFRQPDDEVFKTINSVYLDIENPESIFTTSSECASFSTDEISEENNNNPHADSLEMIIQSVRLSSSERLFYEPGRTSSILNEEKVNESESNLSKEVPFKESVALALESDDPYLDFKKSMQEMVESYGLKDWDCLEELLSWYLKMNGKKHHGFIVGAFVDLLMGLASNDSLSPTGVCSSESTRYSSAGSSFSSPSSPSSSRVVGSHCEIEEVLENRNCKFVHS